MLANTEKNQRAHLTVKQTEQLLHTDHLKNGKPYRFVFLDGCNTAKGGFPKAFCGKNLPKKEMPDVSYFQNLQGEWLARPRAFMGWTKEPQWGTRRGVFKGYIKFREAFFGKWSESGKTLRQAVDHAAAAVAYPGYDGEYTWRDPYPVGKPIVWGEGLVIYGYSGLLIEQFNRPPMN